MIMHKDVLDIDAPAEIERIVRWMRTSMAGLRRTGVILGISGGVDSSVCLALCVRAFGPERVVTLLMPEKDSDPESESLARMLAAHYGVTPVLEGITPALDGYGCYRRRDEAIARVFPEFDAAAGYTAKIGLPPGLLDEGTLNFFFLTIITPDGRELKARLKPADFSQIVSASNFKQRTRSAMLYYHAELRNYAVIGTPNKNEHDQGFFVKHGDGGVDLSPVMHLYKTQIYQLATALGVPELILQRPPTSDTYSAPSTQEEFFFRLPFHQLDLLWFAHEHRCSPEETAQALELTPLQVSRAFADFDRKRRSTEYLRTAPLSMVGLGGPIVAGGAQSIDPLQSVR